MNYYICKATLEDLDEIAKLERLCFPIKEAATREDFEKRLRVYPNHFLVAKNENQIIGAVNGLVAKEKDLADEMYADSSYHDENGHWQMIFGVETHPQYQGLGIASAILKQFICEAKEEKREGIVLTCKENLISFYQKFGFVNEGVSSSEHGGVLWYQMRLKF